jgi:hypothetical protein
MLPTDSPAQKRRKLLPAAQTRTILASLISGELKR